MQNYSTATVEGYATHDAVSRTTKTGKNVCTFAIAINHFSKVDEDPRVSFVDVEAWDKKGEFCAKTITKGKRVMVMGTLRQDRWEGKDGKTQTKIKIIANEIRMIEQARKGEKIPETAAK